MDFGFWFLLLLFIMVALVVAWAVGASIFLAVIGIRESWAESTKRVESKRQKY